MSSGKNVAGDDGGRENADTMGLNSISTKVRYVVNKTS